MSTIALIDDGLNKDLIKMGNIKRQFVVSEGIVNETIDHWSTNITHATLCLLILESLCEAFKLIHIQIMNDNSEAHIDDLVAALSLCCELEVNIISLSVGSTKLSDYEKLSPIIEALEKSGRITIAALSNKGFITLPASLNNVIGVRADTENTLKPFNMCAINDMALGVNVIANYVSKSPHYAMGNSMAVPVVVSHINNYLNKKGGNFQKICEAFSFFTDQTNRVANSWNKDFVSLVDLPSVYFGTEKSIGPQRIKELLNCLASNHQIEAICITNISYESDIRFINFNNTNNSGKNCNANVDLIFFYITNDHPIDRSIKIPGDLDIKLLDDTIQFRVENKLIKCLKMSAFDVSIIAQEIESVFQ